MTEHTLLPSFESFR